MTNPMLRLALVTLVAGSLTACNNRGGGGGGGNTGSGRTTAEQTKTNMAPRSNLRAEGRELAEAYARVPWVHANIAANDWEKALDDLQVVQKKLDGLKDDKNINAALKAKIMAVKPQVALLTVQIQKHDKAAIHSTVVLLDRFASTVDDPMVLAWMANKGGGAGR
ncbi:MAG: hypothetical protein JWM80_4054 [Cyanobacteria bacterium RYN_339]|nr:hypothetical protein [Cyanobacteria bacterium RYN_339]